MAPLATIVPVGLQKGPWQAPGGYHCRPIGAETEQQAEQSEQSRARQMELRAFKGGANEPTQPAVQGKGPTAPAVAPKRKAGGTKKALSGEEFRQQVFDIVADADALELGEKPKVPSQLPHSDEWFPSLTTSTFVYYGQHGPSSTWSHKVMVSPPARGRCAFADNRQPATDSR